MLSWRWHVDWTVIAMATESTCIVRQGINSVPIFIKWLFMCFSSLTQSAIFWLFTSARCYPEMDTVYYSSWMKFVKASTQSMCACQSRSYRGCAGVLSEVLWSSYVLYLVWEREHFISICLLSRFLTKLDNICDLGRLGIIILSLGQSIHPHKHKTWLCICIKMINYFACVHLLTMFEPLFWHAISVAFNVTFCVMLTSFCPTDRLPFSIRVLLESAVRNCDQFQVQSTDVNNILEWESNQGKSVEIPFHPARVILQDFTWVV